MPRSCAVEHRSGRVGKPGRDPRRPGPGDPPEVGGGSAGPFDLVFVDADKVSIPGYFAWALRLADENRGDVIVVHNVVRKGAIVDPDSSDPNVLGVRRFFEILGRERRVQRRRAPDRRRQGVRRPGDRPGGGRGVIHFEARAIQVAVGELQERRPVRPGRVPAGVLAEGDLAVDQRGLLGRELGGAQPLLAQQLVDRPGRDARQNMPLASTQPPSTFWATRR